MSKSTNKTTAVTPANIDTMSFGQQLDSFTTLTDERTKLKSELREADRAIGEFINKNRKHFTNGRDLTWRSM